MSTSTDGDTDLIRSMACRMLGVTIDERALSSTSAIVGRLVSIVAREARHIEFDSDPNEYYLALQRIAAERKQVGRGR